MRAAAEQHDASPDGPTHTFTLRAQGRGSNGEPVTAGDFVHGWLRALDPATASVGADALHGVAGARAYTAGDGDRATLRAAVGVEARGDRTLVCGSSGPIRPCVGR